jgi:hypothetical protein
VGTVKQYVKMKELFAQGFLKLNCYMFFFKKKGNLTVLKKKTMENGDDN